MLQAEQNRTRLARIRALEMLAKCSRAAGDESAAQVALERAKALRLLSFPGIAVLCKSRLPSTAR